HRDEGGCRIADVARGRSESHRRCPEAPTGAGPLPLLRGRRRQRAVGRPAGIGLSAPREVELAWRGGGGHVNGFAGVTLAVVSSIASDPARRSPGVRRCIVSAAAKRSLPTRIG